MQVMGTVGFNSRLNQLRYRLISNEHPINQIGSIADYNVFHGSSLLGLEMGGYTVKVFTGFGVDMLTV